MKIHIAAWANTPAGYPARRPCNVRVACSVSAAAAAAAVVCRAARCCCHIYTSDYDDGAPPLLLTVAAAAQGPEAEGAQDGFDLVEGREEEAEDRIELPAAAAHEAELGEEADKGEAQVRPREERTIWSQ